MVAAVRSLVLFLLLLGACKSDCGGRPPEADGTAATTSTGTPVRVPTDGNLPPAIPHASEAIDKVRPAVRACFAEQLRRARVSKGTVTFVVSVGPDGRVLGVDPRQMNGIDDPALECMGAALKKAVFEAPLDGQPSLIFAPFTFHSDIGG